jgi:hypothetical protein
MADSERRLTTWEHICNSAILALSNGETTYPADINVLLDTDTELRRLRAALACQEKDGE